MSSLFKSPSLPSPPPAPAPAPTLEDPEVKKAAEEERRRLRALRGRKSTILTGAQGITEQAQVQRKTLLGA